MHRNLGPKTEKKSKPVKNDDLDFMLDDASDASDDDLGIPGLSSSRSPMSSMSKPKNYK
jgi:hypothetical protein